MRNRTRFFSLGALVLMSACSDVTGPADELASARNRWSRWGPSDYVLLEERSCECTAAATAPVVVTVDKLRGGISQTYLTGAAIPAEYHGLFPAVEGLFAMIEKLIAEGAHSVIVDYDPVLGFPRSISVDVHPVMVDDEFSYRISISHP